MEHAGKACPAATVAAATPSERTKPMDHASYVALSRQTALSRQMEVIANNIANASTPAFKGEGVLFTEFLQDTGGAEKISFVQDRGTVRNTVEGPLTATANPLDFAIHGDGYFVVQTADGNRYTRAGNFTLDGQGRIVTHEGDPILSAAGNPMTVRPTDGEIIVSRDGTVSAGTRVLGRIDVVTFDNPQQLRAAAGGLFTYDGPATSNRQAEVLQGTIEGSNVQPVVEITRMIELMRNYKSAQTMLEAENERERRAIASIVSSSA
jgi:flagellar basal-body rod protein FlgF